jgi:hypothetical protein
MTISRRTFLITAQAAGMYYAAVSLSGLAHAHSSNTRMPLLPDPDGILDLPEGFSYRIVSTTGGEMADGFLRPGRPDGMACFAYPGDAARCILMRNHENWPDTEGGSPFGPDDALAARLDDGMLFDDQRADGRPFFGGVTKVVYNLETGMLEEDFLVLAGTAANCAGGPTPWGSWLSCEESAVGPEDGAGRNHGFVFETPSTSTRVIAPVPLTAMGRFAHEAVAVDPETGIVYLTEDSRTGLFYRFLPATPGELQRGGRLQALAIRGWDAADTSNWPSDWGGPGLGHIAQGQSFAVDWIDLDAVESPDGDLAERGHAAGAARFLRGEGMVFAIRPGAQRGEIFFTCTQGGVQRAGQVWRYSPSASEGRAGERNEPGQLTLIYESPGADELDMCDNIAAAPWGDLILCEDGQNSSYLRGLTPDGEIYDLAENVHARQSEFCGACFSPDGRVLFVNIQEPGFTLAIKGPWNRLHSA